MSTPQGPNGADRGQPGPKPEDRNESEVKSEAGGPAEPAQSERPAAPAEPAGSQAPSGTSGSQGTPASTPSAPATGSQPTVRQPQAAPDAKPAETRNGRATAPEQPAANPQSRPAPAPRTGGPTPPWQRGAAQSGSPSAAQSGSPKAAQAGSPQNAPQTNVPGVGGTSAKGDDNSRPQRPVAGAAKPAAAQGPAGGATPPTRPVVTGTAAPGAARGAAARPAAPSKSAIIDGPTRHIERKDLAKDLPDLSAVKHPLPSSAPATGEIPQVSAAAAAVPTVVPGQTEPLRATVQVRRIDPWSMLKISAVISVSLFFVWMIAVGLLYGVLAGMGVWDRLNSAFTDIVTDSGSGGLVSAGQVFGYATVIGIANSVLLTALATLGAFIYNLCTDLVGGVQVTLADPD
ncbi:DUF3566 domain-containing protein [Rhodococcus sp. Z13]|uniref:DUF3566 domain-containing protein n=1 Tax=Rhodococcus sacchari TaxID=2962047 RepID=A0ACD4DG28_9NOCA|nr:DUF3566 domain-containing protein [Rhodococcus sp. Z13]UYP19035.1 DUF3566 domain-containing protein [Rhodococcus sp. Z13]